MRRLANCLIMLASLGACCLPLQDQPIPPGGKTEVDQGTNWGLNTRAMYYTTDQGSQIMPLRWMNALKQPNGQPFLADKLARYGYLPNFENPTSLLPAGFTAAAPDGVSYIGMNCAACHTREIEVKGARYRLDGGPAIVDFGTMLTDLDAAVGKVLASDKAFAAFAKEAQDPTAQPVSLAQLRSDVELWYRRYHLLIEKSVPPKGTPNVWGPSRLDAVGMIFNRVAGLDLGETPDHILEENIKVADAPVRYPFLWNAAIQDKTQWPGFAPNGDNLFGLVRNLGEVFGVFATFHPVKDPNALLGVNFRPTGGNPLTDGNSANFAGLEQLENLIRQMGPPKFQWPVDSARVAKGKTWFETPLPGEAGTQSCKDCHGIAAGKPAPINQPTWATPLFNVGTDTRETTLLGRTVQNTGVLENVAVFAGDPLLGKSAPATTVLVTAVGGAILDKLFPQPNAVDTKGPSKLRTTQTSPTTAAALGQTAESQQLKTTKPPTTATTATPAAGACGSSGGPGCYESRVMQGIWAVAPYLHNGSVPTLYDLLKSVKDRTPAFKIGPEYDPVHVGLAPQQTRFNFTLQTNGCEDIGSGHSNCGHTYGRSLTEEQRLDLLEYLKQL